jgi:LmbE family N-acetylglucosaminyl deacetylase
MTKKDIIMKKLLIVLFALLLSPQLFAQELLDYQPKVLLITAHPDDDALFSATVFKTTKLLGGVVDLALMTNGEGGYKYSTLGNYIYGKELDKEEVGRDYLPGIRKKELMAGGDIVGIRNYFFFDQQDFYYTLDVEETMEKWNADPIIDRLAEIIKREQYDFVFLMLPFAEFHGHHKASAVIGLEAISKLPEKDRPIALQSMIRRGGNSPADNFTVLEGYPKTEISKEEVFSFDRNQTFGYDDRLNYNIIANWVIAEHKSQGTMQLLSQTSEGGIEEYYFVKMNSKDGLGKTRRYFEAVNAAQPD